MRATVVGGVGLERIEGEIQIGLPDAQSATAERGLIGAKAVVDELDRDIFAARAAANGVRLAVRKLHGREEDLLRTLTQLKPVPSRNPTLRRAELEREPAAGRPERQCMDGRPGGAPGMDLKEPRLL
jgi:hypothetical protein